MRPVEDSETREIEENTPEDGPIVLPTTFAMREPNMWVHGKKGILINAKTAHSEPEQPEGSEDWDAEAELKKVIAADPYETLLKPIT